MKLTCKDVMPRINPRSAAARPTFLASAVRSALLLSSLSVLSTGTALSQECEATEANVCSARAAATTNDQPHDLSSIVYASLPSAVMTASLQADSATIALTAPLTLRVRNSGNMSRQSPGDVVGLNASMDDAAIYIVNDGSIEVVSSDGGLADGIFSAGARTAIANNGNISALGYTWVAGIENQSSDSAVIRNKGDISAGFSAYGSGDLFSRTYGIFTKNSGDGGTLVDNRGVINAAGRGYNTGIFAYDSGSGGLRLSNAGDIVVESRLDDEATKEDESVMSAGTGVFGGTGDAGGNIFFSNSGRVTTRAYARGSDAVILSALGDGSKVGVVNSGSISSIAMNIGISNSSPSSGVIVAAAGDISISNKAGGMISATSVKSVKTIDAVSEAGNIHINNAGSLLAKGGYGEGLAVDATARNGSVGFLNTGTISVSESPGPAFGVRIEGSAGAAATNSGLILGLEATDEAFGMRTHSS